MDLHKIISELQTEKQRLDEAIQALERLASANLPANGKRRGRPPLSKQTTTKEVVKSVEPRV
jgi:hypothetical protein